jgi:hypothetical protein
MKTAWIAAIAGLAFGITGCTTENAQVPAYRAQYPLVPPPPPAATLKRDAPTYDYTPRVGDYDYAPAYREQAPAPPPQQQEAAPSDAAVPRVESARDFEEPLAEHGRWIDTPEYGRVWQPNEQPEDWRPYTNGRWEYTDYGWTWASSEPWGWACYHYGNWTYYPRCGWVWVPGVVWSPAWVVWRECDDYIAWAPAPPVNYFSFYAAFSYCDWGVRYNDYVVVKRKHFRHDDCRTVAYAPAENVKIVNKTKNVTKTKIVNKGGNQTVVINNGPEVASVEAATNEKVTTRKLGDVVRAPERFRKRDTALATRRAERTTAAPVVADSARPARQEPSKTTLTAARTPAVQAKQAGKQEPRVTAAERRTEKPTETERPSQSAAVAPAPSVQASRMAPSTPAFQKRRDPGEQAPVRRQVEQQQRKVEKQARREATPATESTPPPRTERKQTAQPSFAPTPRIEPPARQSPQRYENAKATPSERRGGSVSAKDAGGNRNTSRR